MYYQKYSFFRLDNLVVYDCHDKNIFFNVTIYDLAYGAAMMAVWNTTLKNCDVILAVTVTSNDGLPLCYVTWDNRIKHA